LLVLQLLLVEVEVEVVIMAALLEEMGVQAVAAAEVLHIRPEAVLLDREIMVERMVAGPVEVVVQVQ
tara:strand:- start:346 stop:546 length:201 start_codon:yes stop_codon:yes gene_type:complete